MTQVTRYLIKLVRNSKYKYSITISYSGVKRNIMLTKRFVFLRKTHVTFGGHAAAA